MATPQAASQRNTIFVARSKEMDGQLNKQPRQDDAHSYAEHNLPLSEQYRIVAKKWVDCDAAANILEECKSGFLAQQMAGQGDMPVSRAEMNVKSSNEWHEYVTKMVEARKQASLLKAQLEYIRMRFSEQQSHEATKRAEMKL